MIRIVLFLFAIICGLVVFVLGWGLSMAHTAGKKGDALIKSIEEKYLEFINSRFNYAIIQSENLEIDKERIEGEVFNLLKPEIDSLIHFINSTTMNSPRVSNKVEIFTNVEQLTNHFFVTSKSNSGGILTAAEVEQMYNSTKDAIKSDVTNRAMKLEMGKW